MTGDSCPARYGRGVDIRTARFGFLADDCGNGAFSEILAFFRAPCDDGDPDDDDREVDAFCFWQEDKPFIFLNTGRTAERMRFDLAHELGHLLLHRHAKIRSRQVEQQAQDFASSFLIPADALFTQIAGELRFDDIFTLKKFWNVSAVAMLQRLWQLRIISEWHYRTWIVELSRRGFRTSEPGGSHPETSRLFRQVLELARQDGWSMGRIASSLNIPVKELESMEFGLTMASAPAMTVAPSAQASEEHGFLRLIE